MERIPAARENFVGMGLVAHIPDHAILFQVEYMMERDRKLDRAKGRCEMPPVCRGHLDDDLTDLCRQRFQLVQGKRSNVTGLRKPGKTRIRVSKMLGPTRIVNG
jgi:hypothetical protein